MSTPAEFEWDEDKAATNIAKHGVDFEAIEALYADPEHVLVDTSRHTDGEPRFKLIAQVEGRLFVAICTMRGAACRVISLRRANASEERFMATVRYKPDPANPFKFTSEELARLDAMTDEEITAAAESDPDNPPLTEDEAARGLFARDVRLAREKTGFSQERFAAALGLPVATLRNWEQGRFNPDPAARALMRIVSKDPKRVLALLAA